jgi:hypothetical protein
MWKTSLGSSGATSHGRAAIVISSMFIFIQRGCDNAGSIYLWRSAGGIFHRAAILFKLFSSAGVFLGAGFIRVKKLLESSRIWSNGSRSKGRNCSGGREQAKGCGRGLVARGGVHHVSIYCKERQHQNLPSRWMLCWGAMVSCFLLFTFSLGGKYNAASVPSVWTAGRGWSKWPRRCVRCSN